MESLRRYTSPSQHEHGSIYGNRKPDTGAQLVMWFLSRNKGIKANNLLTTAPFTPSCPLLRTLEGTKNANLGSSPGCFKHQQLRLLCETSSLSERPWSHVIPACGFPETKEQRM